MVVAISISAMLGSGIFVLPGHAAALTGPSIWMAYLLAGICVLPAALSKAELATAMPTSGGSYVYLERTFGPLIGTIAGLGLWLSLVLKSSFALVGFSAYWSVISDQVNLRFVALSLLGVILVLNTVGVLKVAKVQLWSVVISLSTLLLLFVPGFAHYNPEHFQVYFTEGSSGFLAATAFVFLSYAGVTKIAAISEEVVNPSRNLPLGMLISLGIVMVVYTGIVFVLVGCIPLHELREDLHPIFTLSRVLIGPGAAIIVALIGIVTMASMANSGVLAASRFPYAMSRDSLLPSVLYKVHPKFHTPVASIIATGILMAFIIEFVEVDKIVKVGSAFQIIIFCAENAAVVLLRVTGVQWYKPHYRSPLYPWMQGFGIISGLVLLYELGMIVVPAITSIGLLGTLLFVGFGRYRVARQGVIRLYGRRVTLLLRSSLVRSDKRHPPRSESTSVHTYFSPAEFESTTVDDSDEDHAAVVVPLFGKERSPEMLVEVGAALADGEKVEVVHVTELPEQTVLTALSDDDIVVESLHRRIQTMASREQFTAEFEAVVTHDLIKTVSDINTRTHANWLVIEWKGSSTHGVFFHNPVGWLISNLTCNLALLKDAGVRYIRRILVFCEPGPDERLVASTADHLATIYQAELTFVGVLSEDHQTQERENLESYLQDVKQRCDSNSESVVLIGNDRIRTIVNISAGFDLLVAGSPRRPNLKERLKSSLFGIRTDELTARSACSVLRLRTPRPQSYPESTYTGKVL